MASASGDATIVSRIESNRTEFPFSWIAQLYDDILKLSLLATVIATTAKNAESADKLLGRVGCDHGPMHDVL